VESAGTFTSNLLVPLTSFIGRDREISEIRRLLPTNRLVTLTGTGGVGKTRLALEIASAVAASYPHGVWMVELAALTDPSLVPQAVASVLGVREEPGRPLPASLTGYLRDRNALLVLDNCERLVVACAGLADRLLQECPGVRILATSRECLGIGGETVWQVPPLALPDLRQLPAAEAICEYEAVRLFIERAQAVLPTFTVTAELTPTLLRVCRHLDGLPLAIELAAARVKLLTPEQIEARLSDRFRLLTAGSRTAPRRSQTLRGTLDWSYDLLSGPEQELFTRLAVFAGVWTLEAAEAVCAGGDLAQDDVLELLGRLVDKSLVVAETSRRGGAGYRLLETVRHYARERLESSEESRALSAQHAGYYLAVAEEGGRQLRGAEQAAWLDRLESELDNLRAALAWLAAQADAELVEQGRRLAGSLWYFWFLSRHLSEGLAWLEQLLAAPAGATRTAGRARALYAAGFLATSRPPLEEAVAMSRELGDREVLAFSLAELAFVLAFREGDLDAAQRLFDESLLLLRELGERWCTGWVLSFLGGIAARQANFAAAYAAYEESLAISWELGDRQARAYALHGLGDVARAAGDSARAVGLYEESLAICRQIDDRPNIAATLASLAQAALDGGDREAARAAFAESIAISRDVGELAEQVTGRGAMLRALQGLADLAACEGQLVRAVCLAAAVDRQRQDRGTPASPDEQAVRDRRLEEMRQVMGRERYMAAWAEGWAMPLADAIASALLRPGATRPPVAPSARAARPALDDTRPLTTRERDVAALIAQGLTNRQIADRLVISERTAEGHVANILSKLGLSSRTQVVLWAIEQGLSTATTRGPTAAI
jgi:non-specific serine/threonine protein kinase